MDAKRIKSILRKILHWGLICFVVVAGVVGVCNVIVIQTAKGRQYVDVNEIPYRKVGVVLGTVPNLKNGNENVYYTTRMKATADLYFANKISYIIVSGDNHIRDYNEPECMRNSLIELGIPDSVIYLDYAGFRTFDSMVRAKEVFGQDSFTVISQHWHNERAIYIACHYGIDAIGFDAENNIKSKARISNGIREAFAKTKAVLDICIGKSPKFLGEPVVIP